MTHPAIRIRPGTQQKRRDLASYIDEPISDVIERAIESLRREVILEQTNVAFAKLRNNRRDWAAELTERKAWDGALTGATGHESQ